MPEGLVSVKFAPVTSLGPLLVTTIVYVVVVPGVYCVVPSVLVMVRSATGTGTGVLVEVLLPGIGSVCAPVMVAVLA